jgi:hypothetical protein
MAAAICNSRAGIGPFGFALREPAGRVPGWDFSFVSSFVEVGLLMAQSLLQQKVADLPSSALMPVRAARTRWPRTSVSPTDEISEGFRSAGAAASAAARQFIFPARQSNSLHRQGPIPCLRAAGIRPEIVGFTLNSAALLQAEHQQSTISLHISLLPGNPAVD